VFYLLSLVQTHNWLLVSLQRRLIVIGVLGSIYCPTVLTSMR